MVPTRVEKGTLEVYAFLATVGVVVYTFFKDYDSLKKGVTNFTKDIWYMSSKLTPKVRKRYLSEERRALNAKREQKLKEEILEAERKEKEIIEQLKANNTKK